MNLIISGARVYSENGILDSVAVSIDNGLIKGIGAVSEDSAEVRKFPASYHLIPGFIDMHVHGAQGHDVMDATPEALAAIAKTLAAEGTTAFLATTMTADISQIDTALTAIRHYAQNANAGAQILGVHLEGPFLAREKMGAQPGDKIISPDIKLMQQWEKISGNMIRLVTLAPEQPESIALITYLKKQKIISSIGHTNATYAETNTAIAAGSTHATHLFNAMRGIHQREPGTVTAVLLADTVTAELIVDGVHLHPAIVKLALQVKGKDKIILVTDSMRAKCMQDGCYDLGGQKVNVKDGHAQLADGTLAGSVLQMSSAIQNILKFTGCSLQDAVKMASENPAKSLNIFNRKGSIAPNKDADLVVLDKKLNVVLTVCQGKIVYEK
jgi:N-acetylglucosamine-6-phosphate deacetylase